MLNVYKNASLRSHVVDSAKQCVLSWMKQGTNIVVRIDCFVYAELFFSAVPNSVVDTQNMLNGC